MPLVRIAGPFFAARSGAHDPGQTCACCPTPTRSTPRLRGGRRRRIMQRRPRSVLAVLLVSVLVGVLPALDHANTQSKPIRIGEINSNSGVATV